jgi:hypothetical protein
LCPRIVRGEGEGEGKWVDELEEVSMQRKEREKGEGSRGVKREARNE